MVCNNKIISYNIFKQKNEDYCLVLIKKSDSLSRKIIDLMLNYQKSGFMFNEKIFIGLNFLKVNKLLK